MINAIVSLSIKNKLLVLLFVLGLVAWGIYSLQHLPIGAVPDITNNQVQVITTSRNLSTEDIEQFITYPIELEMANLPGVQEIRSISKFGLSVVTVVFHDDMGTYLPRQLIAEKIKSAEEKIPESFGAPEMGPISTGLGEIYQYLLDVQPGYQDRYSTMELRTLQDWVVKRQLIGIPGVVEVNTWGGYLKQYEVAIDPEKLRAMNVTLGEVYRALEENNENTGGGYIEKYQESYFVRGEGMVRSMEDIAQIVVKTIGGTPLLIGDIGNVRFGHATRFGAITANGEGEKVMGQIMMLKGANSNEVIQAVKERIAEVQETLPEGVFINPFLERSGLIARTTHTVEENLMLGALIVIFVVVLLLGNWRSGLIVASIIPLSLLFAISMMNIFGISANLMSLGAIDFGIIIDGAVIIVEFVVHQIVLKSEHLRSLSGRALRQAKDEITENAAGRMMQSAFFGQVIILIVFLPILTLSGVEGKMFKPMALTFSFALLGAMILCLTYIPVISSLFLKPRKANKKNVSDRLVAWIERRYDPIIRLALKQRAVTLLLAVVLLGFSLVLFTRMGAEFVPTLDEGDYVVQPLLRPGTSLSETIEFCTKIERILLDSFPEVEQVASRIGAAEVPTDPMSMEMSDIIIRLKPRNEWTSADSKEALAEKMKTAMSAFPGVEYEFTQPIEMRFNELITGVRADLAIKIFGDNLDVLYDHGTRIRQLVDGVQGVSDIVVEQIVGLPQMSVQYDRARIAHYGLNIMELNRYVRMAFGGEAAGTVFEGERRFDLVVRLGEEYRKDIENLRQLYVELPNGGQIPLEEVADITIKYGPAQISRDDTRRRIVIGINVRNRDLQSLVDEIQQKIDEHITLPEGYFITYGGQFENLQEATNRLQVAVPIALVLIFIMLYFTFGSVVQALMVYTAIPLAAIGGVVLLWLRDMPFSISAGVGFIALFGIATLNGIVLISYFNELKQRGVSDVRERVIIGAKSRMRPVLLTASAAALGFFPMALSSSAGAEVQRPLATVVIGGLITATLLTLVVLPVIYLWIEERSKSANGRGLFAKLAAGCIALLLISGTGASAQHPAQPISLEEALHIAEENNADIINAGRSVEAARAMVKTGWDLGPTSVSFTRGQLNSALIDNQWQLSQELGSPWQQASHHRWLKQALSREEARYNFAKRQLHSQVVSAYYSVLWRKEALIRTQEMHEMYTEADRIARLKYKTGESNLLSKVMMETRKEQLRIQWQEAEAALLLARQDLSRAMQYSDPVLPAQDSLPRFALPVALDSIRHSLEASAYYASLEAQKRLTLLHEQRARAKLWPAFNAGYFRQEIDGMPGMDGWSVGLKIPLWFNPNIGEIRAAVLQSEMAQNSFRQETFNFQKAIDGALAELAVLDKALAAHQQFSLPNAQLIIENADLLYKNGEIEYLEYIRSMNEAIALRLQYLNTLNDYNQKAIQLFYFTR
jgi:cobalt-zinc-cadmium resistance protein CzcA